MCAEYSSRCSSRERRLRLVAVSIAPRHMSVSTAPGSISDTLIPHGRSSMPQRVAIASIAYLDAL